MPIKITIPRLGWSMEEGTLSEWLKAPGDYVRAGDMLFVLEGEKAAQEIESFDSGYLCIPSDAPQPGQTVKVGQAIGYLLAEGEVVPTSVVQYDSRSESDPMPATHAGAQPPSLTQSHAQKHAALESLVDQDAVAKRVAGPAARRLARQLGLDLQRVTTPDPTGQVRTEDLQAAASSRQQSQAASMNASQRVASPRARRRANELGIDWTKLKGTGRDGRIRECDVLNARAAVPQTQPGSSWRPNVPGKMLPHSKLRRSIAQRMVAGLHTAAPVTLTTKLNARALVAFRETLKRGRAADETVDVVPSYNDIVLQQVAHTLVEMPQLNACWLDDGVYAFEEIHIASAVDTPYGLLAPVVRHPDRLSLPQLADLMRRLIEQARAGSLKQDQLVDATFTVTNLGMFGIDAFTPILNLPQAAILGVGRIHQEPVVQDGRLEIGHTLTLSLTFDHRVVDGAPAARWLQRLSQRLASLPTDAGPDGEQASKD